MSNCLHLSKKSYKVGFFYYKGKFFFLNHNKPIIYEIVETKAKINISKIHILVPSNIESLSHNVINVKYLKLDNAFIEGEIPPNIAIILIKIKNTDNIPPQPIEYLLLLNIPENIKHKPDIDKVAKNDAIFKNNIFEYDNESEPVAALTKI